MPFWGLFGGISLGYNKKSSTAQTTTLRQGDSPFQDKYFDPNHMLRGEKLTLFEQKWLKNKLLFGTEVVINKL